MDMNGYLVVWNINFTFPYIYIHTLGISSSQPTDSHFAEGWFNHQPVRWGRFQPFQPDALGLQFVSYRLINAIVSEFRDYHSFEVRS